MKKLYEHNDFWLFMAVGTYIAFFLFVIIAIATTACDETAGYRQIYVTCMADPSRSAAQCHNRANDVMCGK